MTCNRYYFELEEDVYQCIDAPKSGCIEKMANDGLTECPGNSQAILRIKAPTPTPAATTRISSAAYPMMATGVA